MTLKQPRNLHFTGLLTSYRPTTYFVNKAAIPVIIIITPIKFPSYQQNHTDYFNKTTKITLTLTVWSKLETFWLFELSVEKLDLRIALRRASYKRLIHRRAVSHIERLRTDFTNSEPDNYLSLLCGRGWTNPPVKFIRFVCALSRFSRVIAVFLRFFRKMYRRRWRNAKSRTVFSPWCHYIQFSTGFK